MLKNILANFLGNSFNILIQLLLTPLYLRYFGEEAYGVIGFYLTLLGMLPIIDFGLSITFNRLSALTSKAANLNELKQLGALQFLIVLISIILMVVGLTFSNSNFAFSWFKASSALTSQLRESFNLMALLLPSMILVNFFSNGLLGQERQVTSNIFRVVFTMLKVIALLVCFNFGAYKVTVFFWIQVIFTIFHALSLMFAYNQYFHGNPSPFQFSFQGMKSTLKFSVGLGGASVFMVIFYSLDRICLSGKIALEAFGTYALFYTLSTALNNLVSPFSTALYPRLTRKFEGKDPIEVKMLYSYYTQLAGVIFLPIAGTMFFFPNEILNLVTGKTALSLGTESFKILVVSALLNNYLNMEYVLMSAMRYSRMLITQFFAALVLGGGFIIHFASNGEVVLVSMVYALTHLVFLVIFFPIFTRKKLPNFFIGYMSRDVVLPVLVSFAVLWFFSCIDYSPDSLVGKVSFIFLAWVSSSIGTVLVSGTVRDKIIT